MRNTVIDLLPSEALKRKLNEVEPPLTEPALESELTEEMRADYRACLAWPDARGDDD